MRVPRTQVPLRDPMSSTTCFPSRPTTRACRLETKGSSMMIVHDGVRFGSGLRWQRLRRLVPAWRDQLRGLVREHHDRQGQLRRMHDEHDLARVCRKLDLHQQFVRGHLPERSGRVWHGVHPHGERSEQLWRLRRRLPRRSQCHASLRRWYVQFRVQRWTRRLQPLDE